MSLWLALFGAAPISAQYIAIPPTVVARWVTPSPAQAEQRVTLKAGQSAAFSALVPKRNLVSAEPFLDSQGKVLIPQGTHFIDADIVWGKNIGLPVACSIERQKGNESHLCLVDTDRDGRFESYMKLYANSDYFFMAIARPSPKSGKSGIALSVEESSPPIIADVKLYFENRADWVKVNVFHFCVFSFNQSVLGMKHAEPRCSPMKVEVKDGQYPKVFSYLGGSVEFLSGSGDTVTVRISPPGPGNSI
ncbi:MAG: hypothetical protein ACKOQM_04240 [Novosphingobium sp.]